MRATARLATRLMTFATVLMLIGAAVLTISAPPALVAAEPVAPVIGPTDCAASTSTEDLNAFFAGQVGNLAGFDSPQVIPLPDGRFVWLIQDAYLSYNGVAPSLGDAHVALAHNAMMIQDGACFTVLHGPVIGGGHCASDDASLVGRWLTTACRTWFWPMGGAVDADGLLTVFYVQMENPDGTGAAPPAAPKYTWRARFNLRNFNLMTFEYAVDTGNDVIFGHAVESDENYSYLYGQSRDQFNRPDPTSPSEALVYVARVPRGRFDLKPEYWNGAAWSTRRAYSVPVLWAADHQSFQAHPRRIGSAWIAATKVNDWFTSTVRLDVARSPQGRWRTIAAITVPTRTTDGRTNTYGTQLLPWRTPTGNLVIAVSNNAWNFSQVGIGRPWMYRPTFFEVQAPPEIGESPELSALSGPLRYVPRSPVRAADTRDGTPMAAGETRRFDVGSFVAPGSRAAALNLTTTEPRGQAFATAWPCDQPRPHASSVNALAGGTRAAHAVIGLDDRGGLCVYTNTVAQIVIDISGSYVPADDPSALGFRPAVAQRLYDSRVDRRFADGEIRQIPVPSEAMTLNVAAINPDGPAFVTLFPCAAEVPLVSNLNLLPGQVVANMVDVVTPGRVVCVYTLRAMDIVIDALGSFDSGADALSFHASQPTRIADSRIGVGTVIGKIGTDLPGMGLLPGQAPISLAGLPASAQAMLVSAIAVEPIGAGHATVGACLDDASRDPATTSTLNYAADEVIANQAIVFTPQGPRSSVCSYFYRPAWTVLDLVGWYQ